MRNTFAAAVEPKTNLPNVPFLPDSSLPLEYKGRIHLGMGGIDDHLTGIEGNSMYVLKADESAKDSEKNANGGFTLFKFRISNEISIPDSIEAIISLLGFIGIGHESSRKKARKAEEDQFQIDNLTAKVQLLQAEIDALSTKRSSEAKD